VPQATRLPAFVSYANSVLQALYFCGPFRELVIQAVDASASDIIPPVSPLPPAAQPLPPPATPSRTKPARKATLVADAPQSPAPHSLGPPIPPAPPTLFSALRSLFVHIAQNPADKGTVAPRVFVDKLKELNEAFRNSMHQDAHEFLNFVLNQIVEEIERERKQSLNGTAPSTDDCTYCVPAQ
jgi:ubiquitin carboxyl-terminal hydrolase 9/13